ncbi:unnamed protein product [Rotaria sp. Silwood2]|nr:unnamed protein product [Rotaria sp. Silwood2]CAF2516094.1 unnamed protein product [Rotaria sp. Silwood2]CAF2751245.1 unnamed protein product [Rotaria sp. Silwood2]CAF4155143.1 unnamed protein product [Rotaria sp. Silwood2]CAF4207086.1 unnamed protein product [Rotaria sp. Silwood2]
MEKSSIQLNDLPDEILLIIFKNLNNINLLYSLIGVNKRLNRIVYDSMFTKSLKLFNYSSYDYIHPLPDLMLDRFCLQILRDIHHNIKWLELESSSMKRVFLSANYPNLFGLNETSLMHKYKHQISSLMIKTINKRDISVDIDTLIFTHIFNMFTNLQYLNLNPFLCDQRTSFVYSPLTVFSSTLLELHVKVNFINDCLYLLDGCFNQLRTFCVDIVFSIPRSPIKINKIRSTILLNNQTDLLSNEDIQHTFKNFSNSQIISCVNYFLESNKGQCHIYSCPFTIRSYENIANNFPGGLFTYVCNVSLFDERPFEHEFFIRIAQSFPFIKKLSINNRKAQKNKQNRKLKNNNQDLLIIEYPYLKWLDFDEAHDDYVEQFLLDTKTCLPSNVDLLIDYKPLKRVTHNFRRKTTQNNCAKVRYRCWEKISRFPKHFKDYFLETTNV